MRVLRGGGVQADRSRAYRTGAAAIGALAGTGLLSLLLYATRCREPVTVIGSGLAISVATAVSGGLLGFLFGVPRASTACGQETGAVGGTAGAPHPTYTANTNLEQVSDWLTKLLIGAGLTQLGAVSSAAGRLLATLAPSLGDRPDSKAFAAALVLGFLCIGFLTGWLLTRLLLAPALSQADQLALASFVDAQNLSDTGDAEAADELRARAMHLLGLPMAEAERYDSIRESQPKGGGRTARMQALVDAARETAASTGLTAGQVAAFFAQGSDGQRIYALALMQGDSALVTWDCVLEAIENSRSAFEQYQALVVAESAMSHLGAQDVPRLLRALHTQMNGGWVNRSIERRKLAQRILVALGHDSGRLPS
ncbi:hypothetical protein [Streptomyces sp. NPDC001811]